MKIQAESKFDIGQNITQLWHGSDSGWSVGKSIEIFWVEVETSKDKQFIVYWDESESHVFAESCSVLTENAQTEVDKRNAENQPFPGE